MDDERARKLLTDLGAFHTELQEKIAAMHLAGYDPKEWSRFSQGWNGRLRDYRAYQGLIPPDCAEPKPNSALQSLRGAGVALHMCWAAHHNLLDYERTRPHGVLARLQQLHDALDGKLAQQRVLEGRAREAESDYQMLYAAAEAALMDRPVED